MIVEDRGDADNNECLCHDLDGDLCDECAEDCHVSAENDDGHDNDDPRKMQNLDPLGEGIVRCQYDFS